MGNVAVIEIGNTLARLNVEHTVRGVFPCCLQGFLKQAVGFFRVITELHIHDVHIYGRHTLIETVFLHQFQHLVEVSLCCRFVSAIVVNVAKHVVGHIHLFFQTFFPEFSRELAPKYVSLIDMLTVYQEHNLVASLGIVAVKVVFLKKIVLQTL